MSTTVFTSPYNFVPLSEWVHFPHWDDLVTHDIPFEDGVCGTFDLVIEAKTPVFTRDDNDHKAFCHLDGHPFIKGSTLRGMIRNVLKVATFGKLNRVDDRRFGIRDLTSAEATYQQEMQHSVAGFLRIREDEDGKPVHEIYPCSHARVHREKLEEFHQDKTAQRWPFRQLKGHGERNKRWSAPRDVSVTFESEQKKIGGKDTTIVDDLEGGEVDGKLVFFGFIPNARDLKKEKKHGFFFYNKRAEPIIVPKNVWNDFLDAHSGSQQRPEIGADGAEASESWGYWREQLARDSSISVPVFYLPDGVNGVRSFGLAKAYRRASAQSVHGAINAVSKDHLTTERRDMAELIFGYVESEINRGERALVGELPSSIKGRVSIGSAFSTTASPKKLREVSCLLSSPRASFNPAYLQARGNKIDEWEKTNARASGWKRYPARGEVNRNPVRNEKRPDLETTFEPLAQGTVFRGKVRVHNLRRAELGALLWSITMGGNEELVHRLGLAKSYGYGEVSCRVENLDLVHNDSSDVLSLDEYRGEFEGYMSAMYDEPEKQWLLSEQITSLLAMADPDAADPRDLVYPPLKDFKVLKSKKRGEPLPPPAGIEAQKKKLASRAEALFEKADALGALYESKIAARAHRAKLRDEEREKQAEQERLEKLAKERRQREDEWRATPASVRARTIVAELTPGEAYQLVRAHYVAEADLDAEQFPSLFDQSEEMLRELLRDALRERFHAKWSSGKDSDLHAGSAKLKESAASLVAIADMEGASAAPEQGSTFAKRIGRGGTGAASAGTRRRPEFALIKEAEHRKVPITDAGNKAMADGDWSDADLAILWQWIKKEGLNHRRSKSKKWTKKFEKYLKENNPGALE